MGHAMPSETTARQNELTSITRRNPHLRSLSPPSAASVPQTSKSGSLRRAGRQEVRLQVLDHRNPVLAIHNVEGYTYAAGQQRHANDGPRGDWQMSVQVEETVRWRRAQRTHRRSLESHRKGGCVSALAHHLGTFRHTKHNMVHGQLCSPLSTNRQAWLSGQRSQQHQCVLDISICEVFCTFVPLLLSP